MDNHIGAGIFISVIIILNFIGVTIMGKKLPKNETPEVEVKTLQQLMKELVKIESKRDTHIATATKDTSGIIHQIIVKFVPFSGITDKTVFAQKRKTLYQNDRIVIRQKDGDKLNKGCTELTKSAKVVVSKIRKFILDGNALTEETTYGQILKATTPKKVEVSKNRKQQNKRFRDFSDTIATQVLKLWDEHQKAKIDAQKIPLKTDKQASK
jgi:hypothetical protein